MSTPESREKSGQEIESQWRRAQEGEAEFWREVAAGSWSGIDRDEFINRRQKEEMLRALLFLGQAPSFWSDKTCVEFGSGPSGMIEYLDARRRIAVEPLYEQYKLSFPHLQKSAVEYHGCPAEGPLAIADGAADLVISHNMLDHVFDPEKVMGEIARICRPGGWFLFQVNVYQSEEEIAHKSGHHADLHPCSFTADSALALLERHGFAIRKRLCSASVTELGEYYLICCCRRRGTGGDDEAVFQQDELPAVHRAARACADAERARQWTALMQDHLQYWLNMAVSGVNGQSLPGFLGGAQRHSMEQAALYVGQPLEYWADKTIVELGCGPLGVAEAVAAARRIGIDPLIAEYRELNPALRDSAVDYRDCVAEGPLDLAAGSADLVVCFNMLPFCLDPDAVLAEAARIMAADGYLLVQANVFEDPAKAREIWTQGYMPNILTRRSLVEMLGRHGLAIDHELHAEAGPGAVERYYMCVCRGVS